MVSAKEKIAAYAAKLIEDGKPKLGTDFGQGYGSVDFNQWRAGCLHLLRMIPNCPPEWLRGMVAEAGTLFHIHLSQISGILYAVKHALDNDLLISVESMVMAEAFADLLEQADYLFEQGYFLAAGVLGRAVLEEHLRKLSQAKGCLPSKAKPTLNDYNQALYAGQHLNRIQMKHVEAMAAVGNDAAHNKGTLTKEDVERLLRDVRAFIAANPLA